MISGVPSVILDGTQMMPPLFVISLVSMAMLRPFQILYLVLAVNPPQYGWQMYYALVQKTTWLTAPIIAGVTTIVTIIKMLEWYVPVWSSCFNVSSLPYIVMACTHRSSVPCSKKTSYNVLHWYKGKTEFAVWCLGGGGCLSPRVTFVPWIFILMELHKSMHPQ